MWTRTELDYAPLLVVRTATLASTVSRTDLQKAPNPFSEHRDPQPHITRSPEPRSAEALYFGPKIPKPVFV